MYWAVVSVATDICACAACTFACASACTSASASAAPAPPSSIGPGRLSVPSIMPAPDPASVASAAASASAALPSALVAVAPAPADVDTPASVLLRDAGTLAVTRAVLPLALATDTGVPRIEATWGVLVAVLPAVLPAAAGLPLSNTPARAVLLGVLLVVRDVPAGVELLPACCDVLPAVLPATASGVLMGVVLLLLLEAGCLTGVRLGVLVVCLGVGGSGGTTNMLLPLLGLALLPLGTEPCIATNRTSIHANVIMTLWQSIQLRLRYRKHLHTILLRMSLLSPLIPK